MQALIILIKDIVDTYPHAAQVKFAELRSLIFEVAKDNQLGDIEETLKWGQPSYLSKFGSTVRLHWQHQMPDSIGVYFNCKTSLVETFKEVFSDSLSYDGKRIVLVPLLKPTPVELQTCFLMALNYHRLKKLPLLGA